ncbi:FecR domain-containing protein [Bradyrhizobium sp. Pear76]|uniref:FecR family protein n=1 Tax=Bradyrhizobium oropedii TaxID=1571201 RepID=UPI001E2F07B4|nr:FecR domain-containing protein [Bradyrhizobium oropedii]MCC8962942.1 FecR domain-containing protein [Bradyrhizobium oropedii]
MRSTDHPAALLDAVDREAQGWVLRFAAGKANGADLEAFKLWAADDPARADAFARACRVWDTIGPAAAGLAVRRDHARIAPRPQLARRAFIGGALAASTAAAASLAIRPPLGLWPSVSELAADYRTAIGEQRNIALPGGSSIDLNTRTSIALRTAEGGTERIELLAGEAAVTARDLHRVEVLAAGARAVAEGATFNIRLAGLAVCTTCIAGEMEVAAGGSTVRLRAQQQIIYAAGGMATVTSIDPAAVTAWQAGVLVFHATPLSEAVDEINRYRPGRIIVTNAALGRRLFNARFLIANVDGVVGQIQQVFGATVTNLPGGIVLLG